MDCAGYEFWFQLWFDLLEIISCIVYICLLFCGFVSYFEVGMDAGRYCWRFVKLPLASGCHICKAAVTVLVSIARMRIQGLLFSGTFRPVPFLAEVWDLAETVKSNLDLVINELPMHGVCVRLPQIYPERDREILVPKWVSSPALTGYSRAF